MLKNKAVNPPTHKSTPKNRLKNGIEKFKLKHKHTFPMKANPHFFWTDKLLTKNELITVNIPTKSAADRTMTVRMIKMKREATQLHLII